MSKTKPSVYLKKQTANPRKSALYLIEHAETTRKDLSTLINTHFKGRLFERRDQALITELVYGVFRQRGYLDWQIDQFSRVKKIKTPTRLILRLALYQLLFLDRIPDYAIVNTSVEFSKAADGIAGSRFVNALLRNVIRAKDKLSEPNRENALAYISVTTSHPEWMVRRWLARMGEEKTLEFCRSNNEIPPMTLRVNRLKTNRKTLSDELKNAGASVEATTLSEVGLIVKGLSVASLPSFDRGEFYIQDEGAQLTAYLVDPKPGEVILDVCAAPGGKTTHLAELCDGKANIIATDVNTDRLSLLKENVARLQTPGVKIEEIEEALSPGRLYDKILVDAPCSALGILRRIPEGKWWKKKATIKTHAKLQREILVKALPHLKVGGSLIYVTCSTEPEENENIVETFTEQHPEIKIENPSQSLPSGARPYVNIQGYFTTASNSDKMDRFFAVRWVKQKQAENSENY